LPEARVEAPDIIDELRAAPASDTEPVSALRERAAGEIERLRGERDSLNVALTQANGEVARLREAAAKLPQTRKDLIRRLVAVVISVGFASQIVSLQLIAWWEKGPSSHDPHVAQLARLGTGLLIILLGWDWYERDIEEMPLTGVKRFLLDAVIVLAELVVLLSSGDARLWSSVLVVVFALYVLWDILAIIDHPSAFALTAPRKHFWEVPRDVAVTYAGGIAGDESKRGPPINLAWFIYFLVVLLLLPFPGRYATIAPCVMVALGAVLLWAEGAKRRDGKRYITRNGRFLAFVALAGLYVIYRSLYR
jgi:hypothetical protein